MSWHEDFQPLGHSGILAVGWLEFDHAYAKGEVGEEFAHALAGLLVDPWQAAPPARFHRCDFCRFSWGPVFVSVAGLSIQIGNRILFVPDGPRLFAAPSMILHYVDAHEYAPPVEFQQAVLRCPTMKSPAYEKAIARFAPFLKKLDPA